MDPLESAIKNLKESMAKYKEKTSANSSKGWTKLSEKRRLEDTEYRKNQAEIEEQRKKRGDENLRQYEQHLKERESSLASAHSLHKTILEELEFLNHDLSKMPIQDAATLVFKHFRLPTRYFGEDDNQRLWRLLRYVRAVKQKNMGHIGNTNLASEFAADITHADIIEDLPRLEGDSELAAILDVVFGNLSEKTDSSSVYTNLITAQKGESKAEKEESLTEKEGPTTEKEESREEMGEIVVQNEESTAQSKDSTDCHQFVAQIAQKEEGSTDSHDSAAQIAKKQEESTARNKGSTDSHKSVAPKTKALDKLRLFMYILARNAAAAAKSTNDNDNTNNNNNSSMPRFEEHYKLQVESLVLRLRDVTTSGFDKDMFSSLYKIMYSIQNADYLKANQEYMRLSIGNSPWPIGLKEVGIHERSARDRISRLNKVANSLKSEEIRKWLTSIKRLVAYYEDFNVRLNLKKNIN